MKLLLGLPTAGSPAQPFLESLATLRIPAGADFDRVVVSGNFIPAERELLFEEALERNVDLLAMIDDDLSVPPDGLELLCAALAADPSTALAGALYYSRDGLRPMAVDSWRGENTTTALVPAFDDRTAGIVDGIGFGFVVIRVAALRALEAPYLSAHMLIEHAARRVRVADEDYLFCERLRGAGFNVRLHGGVRCGHYDRASKRLLPERWEPPEITNQRRMHVRTAEGDRLVAPDFSLPSAGERQRPVSITYLSVD